MMIPLRARDITAVVVDNQPHGDHRAGYNGLAVLAHTKREKNLFVPSYAGLNLEHYFDGRNVSDELSFEPRRAPMLLTELDDHTAQLYQEPTPNWKVESWTTFRVSDPHYVDMKFECIPRAERFRGGWMGMFWASYIHLPENKAIYFPGVTEVSSKSDWIEAESPEHGVESTHRPINDALDIGFDPDFSKRFMAGVYSPYRFTKPYYYGVSNGLACIMMFDEIPGVRFTMSPSGGGKGCPAWDFQYLIPDYQVDQRYSFRMRMVYRVLDDPSEIDREYRLWQSEEI